MPTDISEKALEILLEVHFVTNMAMKRANPMITTRI